ncbi:MAG: hypothetical protein ACJ74G_10455 [Blastocatellia bacterium]
MNCNDFETRVTDLARGQMMDADARDRALAHAAGCRRCAARLEDEQRLSAGLSALAGTFDHEQMPARAEAQLLAAFRAANQLAPATKSARRRLAWAAAAAILIALAAFAAVRFVERDKPQPIAERQPATPQETTPSPVAPAVPQPANQPSAPPVQAVATPHHKRPAHRATPQAVAQKPAGVASPTTPPALNAEAASGDEQASEIATSFIPLSGARGLDADNLQLVRVKLPRSALLSFGLPMNVERADERVKADVLVGNDGVARAIRFVR